MKVPFQRFFNGLLAGGALLAGWWSMGWFGLVLAVTVIAFWMILQFNRASRQLRNVADRPKGMVDSVVLMQSRLAHGMSMGDVLQITQSLGLRVEDTNGDWMWRDSYGNQIVVTFRRGGVERWNASRTTEGATDPFAPTSGHDLHGSSAAAAA